ncbi:class D beta-lactamase [Neorhizobium sp. NCHU2750]|uniref:class D beta-lactamase n=1 Tax=Neorhizobium sp. NCHU2750 TaxID=1825976 RepID=UPI000E768DF6|nr:beta-lactamase class D [Neorhizobium sp. NCHU2750]
MIFRTAALGAVLTITGFSTAEAKTICTLVADAASGKVLVEDGDCESRVTPASTFKMALAVIGYDSGFLKDEHAPTIPFKEGYVDWGGEAWKQPTDPTRWLKYSVVWYSQQVTHALGEKTVHDYLVKMHYGNADFSGDAGKDNGLDRAWIASSLKISPKEQVAFLANLVNRRLDVSREAMDKAMRIVETTGIEGGWTVHGKTGMAYPRKPDYTFDEEHPWGWYAGWAEKDGRKVVFTRLVQEEKKMPGTAGNRTRDAMFKELPGMIGG